MGQTPKTSRLITVQLWPIEAKDGRGWRPRTCVPGRTSLGHSYLTFVRQVIHNNLIVLDDGRRIDQFARERTINIRSG